MKIYMVSLFHRATINIMSASATQGGVDDERVCVYDRQCMRSGNLETALAAVDDALQIFTEDDRVWCYREKILSLMSAGH